MIVRPLLLVALAAWVIGCTIAESNLPTYARTAGGPAALLTGELALDDDCLIVVGPEDFTWLVVWPRNYSMREGTLLRDGSSAIAQVGDVVSIGGGEYKAEHYDFLRTELGAMIPESCRRDRYWLATTVVSV